MNDLVRKENTIPLDAEALILKAVENNVNVETMERLLAMRKELKEEAAKEAYFSALAGFQAECPIVKKTREVKDKSGNVRYRYAPLEDIVKQVKPYLDKHGLSFSFKTVPAVDSKSAVDVVCVSQHIFGYSKESPVTIPIEQEAFMNDAQKAGSAQSYAKRYSFCNVHGIVLENDDDDGMALGMGITPQEIYRKAKATMEATLEHIESVLAIKSALSDGDIDKAAEAFAELSNEERASLWVAPTKGGPFTVEERKIMRSPEFVEAGNKYYQGETDE